MCALNIPKSPQDVLKELVPTGQPVDMDTTREFIEQTLENVAMAELRDVEDELKEKGERLSELVSEDKLLSLTDHELIKILRAIFATRRRAKELLADVGKKALRNAMHALLYGDELIGERFDIFVQTMTGYFKDVRVLRPKKSIDSRAKVSAEEAALQENVFCDLASELLHFTNPEEYWLWTRWIWDPTASTGAILLVTVDEINFYGDTLGESYVKIGMALTFIKETGAAAGYENFGDSPYSIDVFMACVYAVYMYTVFRMRLSQEFNRILPELPEMTRRVLGVYK